MEASTADEKTKDDLLEEAREADIEGRSSMSKDELAEALAAQEGGSDAAADSYRTSATAPKTGGVPVSFPTGPVNVESTGRFGQAANRSSSRLGAKKRAARERRAEARADA